MCGIIGFLGFEESFGFILNGLRQLQNRGYDSAGVCTINDNTFKITKYASKENETAIEKIEKHRDNHSLSYIGIGHTRWATHGEKTDNNSHPHTDMYNKFALVHNGIIENYASLKKFLESQGFTFKSQTDTEIIVNLISFHYLAEKDVTKSILKALSKLQGTYALCILFVENPNILYCIRKGSPLIVSANDNFAIVSSENSGFCGMVKSYICLDNHDLCILQKGSDNKITIKTNKNYSKNELKNYVNSLTPEPYQYWTLKEIMEQPESVNRSISLGGRIFNDNSVKLGGLQQFNEQLKEVDNIILLGCGTSLYAGYIGSYLLKELCSFNTVSVCDGSEFHLRDIPKQGKTGLIFLSQSGETKDLFNALEMSKEVNLFSIGVINVVDSFIAKNVDCGVYLNAGREVAVASTKSFSSQVVILTLIGLWFAQQKNLHISLRNSIIKNLRNLSNDIKTVIEDNIEKAKEIANYLLNWNSLFLLGKGINEFYCRESSLKLKEIGYIHSEAYNSSALKHGPYSLLVENQPVIIFVNKDEYLEKNQGIIEEIKSRRGFIIAISEIVPEKYDIHVQIPNNKFFRGLLSNIVLQMVAYELAILKGHNPDMPRNLAKVVTVD